jgi:hypothetical protein
VAAQSAIPRETKGTREMRLVQVIHFTNHLREMMASSEGFMVVAKLHLWKEKESEERGELSGGCCRFGCNVRR